jgi:hypothetical protein
MLLQIRRHAASHYSQTNESNFHSCSFLTSLPLIPAVNILSFDPRDLFVGQFFVLSSVFLLRDTNLPLHFFAAGLGVAATRTIVPVVRESEGLTITLSDSETPLRISD